MSHPQDGPALAELEDMARRAGAVLRERYGLRHTITHKGSVDLVTEADRRSEELILGAIRERYPSHSILSEERGDLPGEGDGCWFVDPLDGTLNYAHALPFFAVSIAYASGSRVRLGVIYDPLRDECFAAERGRGAWLNGQPIHVSAVSELRESLLVTGFPNEPSEIVAQNLRYYERFQRQTQGVRRLGSAALDLAYVACGRLDGFWEIRLNAWDVAAGGLLVEEAGGRATRLSGEPDYLRPPCSILAAGPALHAVMLSILSEE